MSDYSGYWKWVREQVEKERQERIWRRIAAESRGEVAHACCPVCLGKGTVSVCYGSRDDEVRE